jgi:hypothetical protein
VVCRPFKTERRDSSHGETVAVTTAFFIMPPARRLADRIVALIDGRR